MLSSGTGTSLKYTRIMARILAILFKANQKLITNENVKLFAESAVRGYSVDKILSTLFTIDPNLITNENIKLLANIGSGSNSLTEALSTLFKLDPKFINNEMFTLLAAKGTACKSFVFVLNIYIDACPELVTNDALLLMIGDDRNFLNSAIYTLFTLDPYIGPLSQFINDVGSIITKELLKSLLQNIRVC